VQAHRDRWPVERLCAVMQLSTRGYRAWASRPACQRDRTDLKVLAHIREQYVLSKGTYGRPRMTMEIKEVGLDVGERRIGRLMKINGMRPIRTRRHKVTTDSQHRLGPENPWAANLLDGDFLAAAPNQKWAGEPQASEATSAISGPPRAGFTWLSSLICSAAEWSVGRSATG
jgi:putative transposase